MDGTVRVEAGEVWVDAEAAVRLVAAIFVRAGCEPAEAERVGRGLVGANLRGHDSHGLLRAPRYLKWMGEGRVFPGRRITVERETEALAIIDGNYGFGQSVGEEAIALGVAKARTHGVAVTALRNSGHLGRIGEWAERAAEGGCASIHFVNVRGSLLVAPFGATERRGGTSPLCLGVPLPGEPPIVHDFATSLVAEGKALVALRGGKPLPEGSVVTAEGILTADPRPIYGQSAETPVPDHMQGPGSLTAFGLHKGSGLNFFMEMFAGALTGSGTAAALGETTRRRHCNAMLSIYLAVEAFHRDDWFAHEVRSYVAWWKSARPVTPGGEVLVPGEIERRTMVERLASGLPLTESAWADLLGAAERTGLDEAAIAKALAG
jgi:hydroxycarboxylate dehydrogenase B